MDVLDARKGKGTCQLQMQFDKTITMKNSTPGPKFLIMKRIDRNCENDNDLNNVSANNNINNNKMYFESGNNKNSLDNVSPFLIKKCIDCTCGNEVSECVKINNGTRLIKTKNVEQAEKLIKLTALNQNIFVQISEHPTLNYVKGVIYSNDLRDIDEKEIVEELRPNYVVDVQKIKKRVNDNLVETGLVILTFSSTSLPSHINIGYQRTTVRQYIPRPMRCNKCFEYGHIAKFCQKEEICINCSTLAHISKESSEKCKRETVCINCKSTGQQFDHFVLSNSCPVLLKEREIQAIRTLQKVGRKVALKVYNDRHVLCNTYAAVTAGNTNNNNNKNRTVVTYDGISSAAEVQATESGALSLTVENEPKTSTASSLTKNKSKRITILPKNTSKRFRRQAVTTLKRKTSKKSQANLLVETIGEELNTTDSN